MGLLSNDEYKEGVKLNHFNARNKKKYKFASVVRGVTLYHETGVQARKRVSKEGNGQGQVYKLVRR